jgi:hypothetical protein
MNYKEAINAVADWNENDPEKFQAWVWFGSGAKEAEVFGTGRNDVVPFEYLVGKFNESWKWDHREKNPQLYNQDLPENFHLAESETIGGIINRSTLNFDREDHPYSAESVHIRNRKKD